MAITALRGLVGRVRRLSPRAAVVTGGSLMVAGQVIVVGLLLTGAALPQRDGSAAVVVPWLLLGVVVLGLGPVVVAVAAGQPGWVGALAFLGGGAVWVVGTFMTDALQDGVMLGAVDGALPVVSFVGSLAVVGAGRVWHRLAGVAVIAALSGAASSVLEGVSGVVYVGLLVAIGYLVWIAPPTRRPEASIAETGTGVADGRRPPA